MSDPVENRLGEIWVNKFTEESAQKFRQQVLKVNQVDPKAPIIVYIDSYGGYVDALAVMIATLDEVPNKIVTVCMGKAMSCGAILLSHGDIRFCDHHSRVMIHEISSGTSGDVHDMEADVIETKRLNKHFSGLLADNCGLKGGYNELRGLIKSKDGRDLYLGAKEAKAFGIVDFVGLPQLTASVSYELSAIPPRVREPRVKIEEPKVTPPLKVVKAKKPKAKAKPTVKPKTKKLKTETIK